MKYITMSLEEFEELKSYQRIHQELLDKITEDETTTIVISGSSGFASLFKSNKYWMKGVTPENLLLNKLKSAEEKIKELENKKIPVFNFPGTKVKNLQ